MVYKIGFTENLLGDSRTVKGCLHSHFDPINWQRMNGSLWVHWSEHNLTQTKMQHLLKATQKFHATFHSHPFFFLSLVSLRIHLMLWHIRYTTLSMVQNKTFVNIQLRTWIRRSIATASDWHVTLLYYFVCCWILLFLLYGMRMTLEERKRLFVYFYSFKSSVATRLDTNRQFHANELQFGVLTMNS